VKIILVLALSYLLGAIPVGYLVGRYTQGIDIRRYGSRNIGTTNAFRILGTGPGFLVLGGDVLKGLVAVLIGRMGGGTGLALLSGLAAMAGHNWSIFLGFQGGRGVATAAGVILALVPDVVLAALAVWVVVVVLTRYVSLGSIFAAESVPLFMLYFGKAWTHVLFGLVAAALIIYRHRPNIRRLLAGTEFKIGDRLR